MAELPFDDRFEGLDQEVDGWKGMVLEEIDTYMRDALDLMVRLHQQHSEQGDIFAPDQVLSCRSYCTVY